jgi:hypothetical protein
MAASADQTLMRREPLDAEPDLTAGEAEGAWERRARWIEAEAISGTGM